MERYRSRRIWVMGLFFQTIIRVKDDQFSSESHCCYSAGTTGLEPATSAVTGRHSNQLNYQSNLRSSAESGIIRRKERFFRDGKDR